MDRVRQHCRIRMVVRDDKMLQHNGCRSAMTMQLLVPPRFRVAQSRAALGAVCHLGQQRRRDEPLPMPARTDERDAAGERVRTSNARGVGRLRRAAPLAMGYPRAELRGHSSAS